ncbi:GTPase [Aureococcus anophagefferens]|nr:GTPase [Aureococcus anophagefferens]
MYAEFPNAALPLVEVREGPSEGPAGWSMSANDDTLKLLSTIEERVCVVTVVGLYRSGKSSLLNWLRDPEKPGGFAVGHGVSRCTKGIWVWGRPAAITLEDGSSAALLLLDTEGLGGLGVDGSYDATIFSLAALLASTLAYNSLGALDEHAISNLGFVARLSASVRARPAERADRDDAVAASQARHELSRHLPAFLWVLRDFALDLVDEDGTAIDSDAYLERALAPRGNSACAGVRARDAFAAVAFGVASSFEACRALLDAAERGADAAAASTAAELGGLSARAPRGHRGAAELGEQRDVNAALGYEAESAKAELEDATAALASEEAWQRDLQDRLDEKISEHAASQRALREKVALLETRSNHYQRKARRYTVLDLLLENADDAAEKLDASTEEFETFLVDLDMGLDLLPEAPRARRQIEHRASVLLKDLETAGLVAAGSAASQPRWKLRLQEYYEHHAFQVLVATLIVANFVMSIVEKQLWPSADPAVPGGRAYRRRFTALENTFNALFTVELAFNMVAFWWRDFWRSNWNVFDFVTVTTSWLFFFDTPLPGPLSNLRMVRALRVFRLFKRVESLRKIIESMANALVGLLNACLILFIVMCIYAILGVDFFGHIGKNGDVEFEWCAEGAAGARSRRLAWNATGGEFYEAALDACPAWYTRRGEEFGHEYVGTFFKAMFTMLQILAEDEYLEAVGRPLLANAGPFRTGLFLGTYYMAVTTILLNVVVAVLLDKMVDDEEEDSDDEDDEEDPFFVAQERRIIEEVHRRAREAGRPPPRRRQKKLDKAENKKQERLTMQSFSKMKSKQLTRAASLDEGDDRDSDSESDSDGDSDGESESDGDGDGDGDALALRGARDPRRRGQARPPATTVPAPGRPAAARGAAPAAPAEEDEKESDEPGRRRGEDPPKMLRVHHEPEVRGQEDEKESDEPRDEAPPAPDPPPDVAREGEGRDRPAD